MCVCVKECVDVPTLIGVKWQKVIQAETDSVLLNRPNVFTSSLSGLEEGEAACLALIM